MLKSKKNQLYLSIAMIALSIIVAIIATFLPYSRFVSNDYFHSAIGIFGFIGPLGGYLFAAYEFKSKAKFVYNLEDFENGCQFEVIDPQTPHGERGIVVKAMVKRKGEQKEFFVTISEPNAVNGGRYLKTDDTLLELASRKN